MNSGPPRLFSRRRVLTFLVLWAASIAWLYAYHLRQGWYHGQSSYAFVPCALFVWPAPGVACACLVLIQWLWVTDISDLRKVCFTVLALAITVPMVAAFGFTWMLMHLAP